MLVKTLVSHGKKKKMLTLEIVLREVDPGCQKSR